MPNHKTQWVNDHTQICDRLDEHVQLMEDYLDSKPEDFDGIDVKRFLLGQAHEQMSWYRQSIEALDFVGCVACRRSLETGQAFWNTISLHATSGKPSAGRSISGILRFHSCPRCGHSSTMRVSQC